MATTPGQTVPPRSHFAKTADRRYIRAMRRALIVLAVTAAAWGASQAPDSKPSWLRVDYRSLVDGRKLTHSGEPVAALLEKLGGRPRPPTGTRSDDALAHRLLDPVLEPYAFVLEDALDA